MDAAQMLTAQEIARQCEQLARTRQHAGSPESAIHQHLRLAEPVTEPIPRIIDPVPEPRDADDSAPHGDSGAPDGSGDRGDAMLSEREQGILAFERQWWKRPGAKEQAIRELFDMSASRYYQVLNALVDNPAAFRADPMLIKRLRKVRASRQRARDARRLGIELH